ncbi:transmembrane protein 154 [Leptodactylus fuscus]|uniref:transmembrane protein 154 n=1 Tax=Leptodactylus fuscus TaxID=238119 RepID=UPI003F4E6CF0
MDESTTEEVITSFSETSHVLTSHEDQTLSPVTLDSYNNTNTESPSDSELDVMTLLIYAAPAIILILLIPIIVLIVQRKRRKKRQEAILDVPADNDLKSPIFEEDTPSVMEIEMDDLDKWMSNMKNSCRLSTLEEESKFHTR